MQILNSVINNINISVRNTDIVCQFQNTPNHDELVYCFVTRVIGLLLYYYISLWTRFLWPLRFGWLLVLSVFKEGYLFFLYVPCW